MSGWSCVAAKGASRLNGAEPRRSYSLASVINQVHRILQLHHPTFATASSSRRRLIPNKDRNYLRYLQTFLQLLYNLSSLDLRRYLFECSSLYSPQSAWLLGSQSSYWPAERKPWSQIKITIPRSPANQSNRVTKLRSHQIHG
jgi:hypothetical protein